MVNLLGCGGGSESGPLCKTNVVRAKKMYISGTYVVVYDDETGFHRGGVFETEREARDFGNRLWRNPSISSVEICRRQFHKKRRNCVTIAKAER